MKNFREIISDIDKGKFAPVYLLSGEETYYLDKITERLESRVVAEEEKDFDQTLLFGADSSIELVMEAASRYPMLSPYQLVILKEAQTLQNAKNQIERLKHYVENPTPTTVLAVVFKGGKLNATGAMMKAAAKNEDIVVFHSPKIREYQFADAVKDYCRSEKIQIEEKAVAMLVEFVGNSLDKVVSEIEKLQVALKSDTKKITAADVERNIGISKDFNNFELVNAIAKRDYPMTMRILKHFSDNPKGNPAIVTAATIFAFFQKLTIAHFSTDKSEKGLMEALQLKTPYALREIRTGMTQYNASQCVSAIHQIRLFDTKSKGVGSFQKEHPLLRELIFSIITS